MIARCRALALGSLAGAFVAAAAVAQDDASVFVLCVGPDGAPTPGAIVHLLQITGEVPDGGRFVLTGRQVTDADGRASFDEALTHSGGAFDRVVHARLPGELVGAARATTTSPDVEPVSPIQVPLVRSRSWFGTVTVPEGFRATDVCIRVQAAYQGPNGRIDLVRKRAVAGLFDALPHLFETHAAADGRFELRDLPVESSLYVIADGPGLAPRQWMNRSEPRTPLALDLVPHCVLAGRVLAPDGAPCRNASVAAWYGAHPEVSQTWQRVDHRTRTDEHGAFRIEGLPPIDVYVQVSAAGAVSAPERHRARRTDVDAALLLRTVRGHRVAGEVVRADGGKPVEGAWLDWRTPGSLMSHGLARTDRWGRFDLLLPEGPVEVALFKIRGDRRFFSRTLDVIVSASGKTNRPLHFEIAERRWPAIESIFVENPADRDGPREFRR